VAAIASTPIVEVASRMLRKLLSERKKGESTAIAALSAISTTKDSSLMCSRSTEARCACDHNPRLTSSVLICCLLLGDSLLFSAEMPRH